MKQLETDLVAVGGGPGGLAAESAAAYMKGGN